MVNGRHDIERHVVPAIHMPGWSALGNSFHLRRGNGEAVVGYFGNGVRIVVAKVCAANVHAILVVTEVNPGIVTEAWAAL